MKTLVEHLTTYASYHKDKRNIFTHYVGIPMIVLSVATLLSRPEFQVGDFSLNPALLIALLCSIFYFRLSLLYGLIMTIQLVVFLLGGLWLSSLGTEVWLSTGVGLFVVGWTVQFVGHYFEGRKPAFFDDITGLVIGPLFITVKLFIALGFSRPLAAEIENRTKIKTAD